MNNNNKFSNRGLAIFDSANQYNLNSQDTATSAKINKLNNLLEDERAKSTFLQNKLQKVQDELKTKIIKTEQLTAEIHILKAEIQNLTADRENLNTEKDEEKAAMDKRLEKIKKSKQRKNVCKHGKTRASR